MSCHQANPYKHLRRTEAIQMRLSTAFMCWVVHGWRPLLPVVDVRTRHHEVHGRSARREQGKRRIWGTEKRAQSDLVWLTVTHPDVHTRLELTAAFHVQLQPPFIYFAVGPRRGSVHTRLHFSSAYLISMQGEVAHVAPRIGEMNTAAADNIVLRLCHLFLCVGDLEAAFVGQTQRCITRVHTTLTLTMTR